jgi:pimeloyl-ACP methyl ester carboxylesterase
MVEVLDDVLILRDARRLGYRVRGDRATGTPILHFHGQPGSRFEADVYPDAVLTAAGVQVIAYDRPGMGRSDLVPARDMTEDLPDTVALLDHLGVGRVGVVGVSAGGPWAFAFAATYPDRVTHLVPVSASGPYDEAAEPFMHEDDIEEMRDIRKLGADAMLPGYEAVRARMLGDFDAEVSRWFGDFPHAEAQWATRGAGRDVFRVDMVAAFAVSGRGYLRESEVRALPWSFDPGSIRCPVRAFHGDRDSFERLDNLQRVLGWVPDGSVTVFPGGDHLSALLHPDWLVAAAIGADVDAPSMT